MHSFYKMYLIYLVSPCMCSYMYVRFDYQILCYFVADAINVYLYVNDGLVEAVVCML